MDPPPPSSSSVVSSPAVDAVSNESTNDTTVTPVTTVTTSTSLSTNSEEWQVVEIPEDSQTVTTSPPTLTKAQKWKERLAKKSQIKGENVEDDEETKLLVDEDPVDLVTKETVKNSTTSSASSTDDEQTISVDEVPSMKISDDQTTLPTQEQNIENEERKQGIQTMSLQASYQQIAEAKRQKEEAARLELEKQIDQERLAKEAERIQSIERLEEDRKQLRLEEERKAREERQQQSHEQSVAVSAISTTHFSSESSENSSPATSHSKSIVVLVSKSFGTAAQRANQDRAITTLKGQQIPFDEVDGSDPALKDLRNDLFAISGIRGTYPQFFIQEGDQISFLGDFEAFEYMNESCTLSQPFLADKNEPTVAPEGQVSAENDKNPCTKMMIVLVSKSFGTMAQRTSQERALTTLNAREIPYEEVDGSDPAWKDRRTELFNISGLRGKYPQFFVKDGEHISFLGDFEVFESMNETGELEASFVAESSEPRVVEVVQTASSTSASVSVATAAPETASENSIMIVLVSKSFGSLGQKTNQDRAGTILNANKIPFEQVDGSDPEFKDLRDALFAISGIRGNYPQFFVKEDDRITYIGDFEALETMNEAGTLPIQIDQSIGMRPVERISTPPPNDEKFHANKLIVLVSKSFGTIAQKTNQDRAITMLSGKQIPFEEVDGSDPGRKDRRDELFMISGIRGNYPQFFLETGDQTTFLGDFDALEALNEIGQLSVSLLADPTSKPDQSTNERTTPAPDRISSRTVSFDGMPNEIWENEFETTPLQQEHSRALSKDTVIIPTETFENEFDDDDDENGNAISTHMQVISSSTSRTNSGDSFRIPSETFENEFDETRTTSGDSFRIPSETFENEFDENQQPTAVVRPKISRLNSEDSDMMPGEAFENEFEPSSSSFTKCRSGRKTPDDVFENEFEPIEEEDDVPSKPIPLDDDKTPSILSPMYLHIAIGVLGVAVIIGIWLSGPRGSHSH